jgi:HlyD family secretion protein
VSGQLIEVAQNTEEGKQVKKGDLLAAVDPIPCEIALRRAKASLKQAEARLAELKTVHRPEEVEQAKIALSQAEERLKQVQAEAARLRKLREKEAVVPEELEMANGRVRLAELDVAKARAAHELLAKGARKEQLDATEAAVEMARADVDLATYNLAGTKVAAPISGTILKRNAQIGAPGTPPLTSDPIALFTIADLSKLEVDLDVQERDINLVSVGQKCAIRLDPLDKTVYQGKVSRLLPLANRAKGTVGVRVTIDVPAADTKLRPEVGAIVSFIAKE